MCPEEKEFVRNHSYRKIFVRNTSILMTKYVGDKFVILLTDNDLSVRTDLG